MGVRLLEAARQGECERNLRLLASYITEELKLDIIEPANVLDMARRIEGLSLSALKATACIAYRIDRQSSNNINASREIAITAPLLANPEHMQTPMNLHEAEDALADLQGRGFIFSIGSGYGGGEFYKATKPMLDLIGKAIDLDV